jgi:RNA polymerase sigma factor (sigma-70 family)
MASQHGQAREAGEQQLVAELARAHRPALLRYFGRKGFSPSDAEDAAQDVLLRMSRRADVLEGVESAHAYLFTTAAHVATDKVRLDQRRRGFYHQEFDEELHGGVDHSPEDILDGRESLARVMTALRELPDKTRVIFALARFERMHQAEIARRLEIGLSTVEKHIARAMAHLARRGCRPQ